MIKRVKLQPIAKDKFRTLEKFEYKDVKIPKGFVTNGANIPRVFWSLFPPNSPEYLSAVVVHDYMCANMKCFGWKKADKYFYEAMLDIGVSKWKAKTFYFFCYYRHLILKHLKGREYKVELI